MKCVHPIWIESEKLLVPCGRCPLCKVARSKDWATRIMHESEYHDKKIFCTFTYQDMPKNQSISKREIQLFIKKLRKTVPGREIKYYLGAEYGEEENRPHWHMIIFGMNENDFEYVTDIWNKSTHKWERAYYHKAWMKGLIHIGEITYDSARYTADYCLKNKGTLYGWNAIEEYGGGWEINDITWKWKREGGREQPFQLFSKGLGRRYALDNRKYLEQKLGCTVNGREVGLPKYYRNVLGIEGEEVAKEQQRRKLNVKLTEEEKLERKLIAQLEMGSPNRGNTRDIMQKIYDQRLKNYNASKKLRGKV